MQAAESALRSSQEGLRRVDEMGREAKQAAEHAKEISRETVSGA